MTADATAEDLHLGPDIVHVLEAVAAKDIEVALGTNDQLMISALRVPGADGAAMDAALLDALSANTSYSSVRVESIAGRAVHAFDSLYGTQYAWVNGDILFWVLGLGEDAGERAVGAMPGSSVPLVPGGATALAETTVDLTIGSGPDAGSYHAVAETGGCSTDALGPDQFGLQYSTTDPVVVFSSLQVIIDDGHAAGGKKGSKDFSATATVNGTDYQIDPGNDQGRGTAWVTVPGSGGAKAEYLIKGRTKDKVAVEAVVSCALMTDFGS
jgi:hypothetical protein